MFLNELRTTSYCDLVFDFFLRNKFTKLKIHRLGINLIKPLYLFKQLRKWGAAEFYYTSLVAVFANLHQPLPSSIVIHINKKILSWVKLASNPKAYFTIWGLLVFKSWRKIRTYSLLMNFFELDRRVDHFVKNTQYIHMYLCLVSILHHSYKKWS